ncbi:MAG: type II secretion system protein [Planctomycetota bacterium]|jgi:general secretion pathway protein G
MKAKSGFTLVEILIVVVILGILAAIVIPQFTSASTEAKESALQSDLQAMRSQIELFKIHHNDLLPGEEGTGPLDPALVATTTARFQAALISKTNQAGAVGTTAAHRFGPYMRSVPDNPFSSLSPANTVEVDGTAGGDDFGWHLTTAAGLNRGLFQADDDGVNAVTSVAHIAY